MPELFFQWSGLLSLPWWGYVLLVLGTTHITIICVTLFLHRSQAHKAVVFHPAVAHLMRLWLWSTTGLRTKAWVAVHRKHHAAVETENDPHSPVIVGIRKVLFQGTELYRAAAMQKSVIDEYGRGTPDDWIERNLYSAWPNAGVTLLLIGGFLVFGWAGVAMWAVQMAWIPFLAAGVINGGGHYAGYRNFGTDDASTNLINIGWLIGGEELHNNHHAFPSSAKFSIKWWEIDAGWLYLRLLSAMRLAQVRRVAPVPGKTKKEGDLDGETLQDLLSCHLHVMAEYIHHVVRPALNNELRHLRDKRCRAAMIMKIKGVRSSFVHLGMREKEHKQVNEILRLEEISDSLHTVYELGCRLRRLWSIRARHGASLHDALLEWCQQAEKSGYRSLQEFALRIKGYSLKSCPA